MRRLLLFTILFVSFMTVCSGAGEYTTPAGDIKQKIFFVDEYDGEIIEYTSSMQKTRSVKPDWLDNGSRNFYNHIGTLENGEELQSIYDKLYYVTTNFAYDAYGKMTIYDSEYYLCADISSEYEAIEQDNNSVYNVVFAFLNENPQIFYDGDYVCILKNSNKAYLSLHVDSSYVDGSVRVAEADAITIGVQEYDEILDTTMSAYAIEKRIHDKLILDNNYAFDEEGNPEDAAYAHSIAGSLNSSYGGGVCESYAKAFQLLLNRYNVDNYMILGLANSANHAWSFVKLDDGNYYCVDVTWDDATTTNGNHVLSYKYFNMPYSDFYSVRDNSLTKYPEAIPVCSESNIYYTSNPNQQVGVAENGDIIYLAPEVAAENETRTTEASTETTTEEMETETSTEGVTEVTTNNLQIIASDSVKNVVICSDGNWSLGQFYNSEKNFALTSADLGELWLTLDEDCVVSFNAQLNGGKISIYVDNTLIEEYTQSNYGYLGHINIPAGWHKLRFVYTKDGGSYGLIHSVKVISNGDYNKDAKVDMTDAVALLKLASIELDDYLHCDLNNDSMIDSKDVALIIKKISGISY